jgi:hypothetical protein
MKEKSNEKAIFIYPYRVASRHRDYRHLGEYAFAGLKQG